VEIEEEEDHHQAPVPVIKEIEREAIEGAEHLTKGEEAQAAAVQEAKAAAVQEAKAAAVQESQTVAGQEAQEAGQQLQVEQRKEKKRKES